MDDQNSYTRLKQRLEDIVVQVRSKDVSLEKSLDLYEEALRIGGRCVEQLDRTDFTAEELVAAEGGEAQTTGAETGVVAIEAAATATAPVSEVAATEESQAGNG
ncbi:MAG: exodeoxyribonuclease VII small subunit [Coriobacteriales bacterium]|jgi:exodeoxyribonuclease VII small subunit|nr:exodeoxyribonuclease VII small subunit [Coriobacteriales bacterium]